MTIKRVFRNWRSKVVVVGALAIGGSVGVFVSGSVGGAIGISPSTGSATTFPTNANGQTYGSSMNVSSVAAEPDLIAAFATNGQVGYISKSALNAASGGNITTPAQAAASDANRASQTNPVYAVDGTTVIGTFTTSPGVLFQQNPTK